ncbi:MAG: hypothetical protein AAFR60_05700, partial [Pseudomonadota bacterium]
MSFLPVQGLLALMTDAAITTPRMPSPAIKKPLIAADGIPLKQKLARTTAASKRRAFYFTLPLVLFVIVSFVLPIGEMLVRSFYNPVGGNVVPTFAEAIKDWDGKDLPSEQA